MKMEKKNFCLFRLLLFSFLVDFEVVLVTQSARLANIQQTDFLNIRN